MHRQRDDRPGPREADRRRAATRGGREDVLERREDSRTRSRLHPRHGSRGESVRSSTWSTPPWLHGLQRRSRQPASTAPSDEPVLAEGVDRVLRAARVVLAGAGRRQQPERVAPRLHEPRSPIHSHACSLAEHLAHLLHEPFVAAGLGRLGEARAGPRGRSRGPPARSCRELRQVSRSWRLIRFRVTACPTALRDGEAEARLAGRRRRRAETSAASRYRVETERPCR